MSKSTFILETIYEMAVNSQLVSLGHSEFMVTLSPEVFNRVSNEVNELAFSARDGVGMKGSKFSCRFAGCTFHFQQGETSFFGPIIMLDKI